MKVTQYIARLCSTLLLVLAGCASQPTEPCSTLKCVKDEQRQELYKQCVNTLMGELYEEIQVGLYDAGDLVNACGRWSREAVR